MRVLYRKTKTMRIGPVSDLIDRQLYPKDYRRQSRTTQISNEIIYVKITANPIRDSINNIIDSKSKTKNTEDATLVNTFSLVKKRGEGVPNSNTKGTISQQMSDEDVNVHKNQEKWSLPKTPRFNVVSYAFCKSKKTTRTNLPFSNAAEILCSKRISGSAVERNRQNPNWRGINPGCPPRPKPSAPPPFAPKAYKDKRPKGLDGNVQAKSDRCLV